MCVHTKKNSKNSWQGQEGAFTLTLCALFFVFVLDFCCFFFSHLNMNNVTWFFMLLKYYSFSQTQHFEIIVRIFRICRNSRFLHVEV